MVISNYVIPSFISQNSLEELYSIHCGYLAILKYNSYLERQHKMLNSFPLIINFQSNEVP